MGHSENLRCLRRSWLRSRQGAAASAQPCVRSWTLAAPTVVPPRVAAPRRSSKLLGGACDFGLPQPHKTIERYGSGYSPAAALQPMPSQASAATAPSSPADWQGGWLHTR